MKNFLLLFLAIGILACATQTQPEQVNVLRGETMGTYYQVSYVGAIQENLKVGIDSLLAAINGEVSTYEPNSTITRFNQSSKGIDLQDAEHFRRNFEAAKLVFKQSQGAFDPTVMPLVNFWGFGYAGERQHGPVDSAEVETIRQWVGFDKVWISGDSLLKTNPETKLDFSAVAKGYGVDETARYLERKGIENYLVDIGGESTAKGKKPEGANWRVGINVPDEDAAINAIITAFDLKDRSVATSGNYRNWYEIDGVKYSHTINPKTGFPERTELLSASVFHEKCMMADAYATACMVLGVEKALSLAESNPDIDIYLIFSRSDGGMETRYSSGLNALFNE